MTTQKNYLIGFTLAAAILGLVGLVVVIGVNREQHDYAQIQHTYEVIGQLDQVKFLERDAISWQRAYLLTNNADARQQYWKSREGTTSGLASLQLKVADNPAQSERVHDLQNLIGRRMTLAANTIDIHDAKGLAEAQKFILNNGSLQLDGKIKLASQVIHNEEIKLLVKRGRDIAQSRRSLYLSAILGIPVSLLIISVIYWLLRRENAQRALAEASSQQSTLKLRDSVEQLQYLSKQMSSLANYSGMLQSCRDSEEVLTISCQAWGSMMPYTAGNIYLMRSSGDIAEIAATWGEHLAAGTSMPKPDDCWAMRRQQPFLLNDVYTSVRCAHVEAPAPGHAVSTTCLPLSAQGETLGWVYLSSEQGKMPDKSLMISSSEQLSLALANLRLKDKLKQQSIRDPLTNLFNRRYLEESLERELARCQRRNLPLSILMIDIDHFKKFNDTHGHPGGDALLSNFGRLLASVCRSEDIPCRYGGEEFLLVLPECDIENAKKQAQRINQGASEMRVQYQNQVLSTVTASIGISSYPENAAGMEELISLADTALYRAKSLGRNRTEVSSKDAG